MPKKLELLRDMSADLGFARDIEQVPAEMDCPTHEIPLVEHRVETIGGWQAVYGCPQFNGGECRYDPDAEPMQIEPPTVNDDDQDGKTSKNGAKAGAPKSANSGGF